MLIVIWKELGSKWHFFEEIIVAIHMLVVEDQVLYKSSLLGFECATAAFGLIPKCTKEMAQNLNVLQNVISSKNLKFSSKEMLGIILRTYLYSQMSKKLYRYSPKMI